MNFSQESPPTNGTLVQVHLNIVSRSCGSLAVGYFQANDDLGFFLSDGNRQEPFGWDIVSSIDDNATVDQICIDI